MRFCRCILYFSQSGWTALHNAAMSGNTEAVQLLVKHGADTSVTDGVSGTVSLLAQRL